MPLFEVIPVALQGGVQSPPFYDHLPVQCFDPPDGFSIVDLAEIALICGAVSMTPEIVRLQLDTNKLSSLLYH
jgi:hypothetical protein